MGAGGPDPPGNSQVAKGFLRNTGTAPTSRSHVGTGLLGLNQYLAEDNLNC